MTSAITWFDLGLIGITLISVFVGFLRGFCREVLSILGWVGAIIMTIYFFPSASAYAQQWISNKMLADMVTGIILFIVFLSLFITLNRAISDRVKASALGGLDRSLGVLFGLLRASIFVLIGYFAILYFFTPENQPDGFKHASTLPLVKTLSDQASPFLPKKIVDKIASRIPEHIQKIGLPDVDMVKSLSHIKAEILDDEKQKTSDRDMERLVDRADDESSDSANDNASEESDESASKSEEKEEQQNDNEEQ